MLTQTSLSDFANAIEKLDASGSNWVMWERRFTIAVRRKEVFSHFDGTCVKPKVPSALVSTETAKGSKTPEELQMSDYVKKLAAWQKKEDLAMHLLVQSFQIRLSQSVCRRIWLPRCGQSLWPSSRKRVC